jgi:hypothetical protein
MATSKATPNTSPQIPNPDAGTEPAPSLGWNRYAERVNGRFAMVGFLALLALEFFTQQDFWTWVGLR